MTALLPIALGLWLVVQLVGLWRDRQARALERHILEALLNVDDDEGRR